MDLGFEPSLILELVLMATELRKVSRDMEVPQCGQQCKSHWQDTGKCDLDLVGGLFNHQVMSDSLQPHGLQYSRLPCPSLSPRVCSNSYPLSGC